MRPPSRLRSIRRCASIREPVGYDSQHCSLVALSAPPPVVVESPHHRGAPMRPPLVSAMRILTLVAAVCLPCAPLAAQSNEHVIRGDEAYAALKPADAIAHYEAAVAQD